jgi:RimJ/RimL family protein N-acetyltransferase
MAENRGDEDNRGVTLVGHVLFGADAAVTDWVAQRIPGFRPAPGMTALGVVAGDDLVAGVVFDNFNGIHIEAAIAADTNGRWAGRETLRTLFAYPFIQLGCMAISVSVPSTNLESLNLATKLGFRPEAFIRFAAHDGSSLVVLKMLKSDCGWIVDHGKEKQ